MNDEIKTIEFLKTGLSLQTHIGCPIKCSYCVVTGFYDDMAKSQQLVDTNTLINDLITHEFFNDDVILMVNNKTEGFQPKVEKYTFDILDKLKNYGIKNPKILITKLPIPLRYTDSLTDNNVFVFTTYSGMPSTIEPTSTPTNLSNIVNNIKVLRQHSDARHVHYWRPIVRNINSDSDIINNILDNVNGVFDCSVISGIRLTPVIKQHLESRGADFYDWNGDINHKFLPEDIYNQIIQSKNALCPEYKLFTKTSCSISHLLNNFDANLNFVKRNYSCSAQCPNGSICKSYQPRYTDNEREILKKFNLLDCANFIDGVLYINKPISQELKAFLTQTIKLRIIVPETLKSHTEGIFNARNGRSL